MRRAALRYGLARVGLFLLVTLLVWSVSGLIGAQLNGLPLVLVAALISSVLGYYLFARLRVRLAEGIEAQRGTRAEKARERRARLDDES